jgi:hypothetical protein
MAVVVLTGLGGGCYWLSLVASLNGLEAGIKERDVVKLDKYIDWARVREQVRSDLHAFVMTQVFKEAKGGEEKGLAFSIGTLLAGAVAPAMIDRVVDGFVTPQALIRLLTEKPPSEQTDLTFDREGFTDLDEYTLLLGASGPTRPRIRAILRRDGITWRVVRVVFHPGQAPWETNATGPAAARLHALTEPAPRLELRKVVPTRTANSLVIEGDVTNSGNMASDVPQLRVVLRDSAEKEVQFKIIDPPKARLGPSETARFKTTFDHPDDAAIGVVVTFSGPIASSDYTNAAGRETDSSPSAPPQPEPPKTPTLNKKAPNPRTAPAAQQMVKNESKEEKQDSGSQPAASYGDLVKDQVAQCWNVPAGAHDAKDLVIEMSVAIDPDGTVRQATIVDQARLGSDALFRAAAESARRSFFNPLCRPLHLPPDKYAIWKNLIVKIGPKDAL